MHESILAAILDGYRFFLLLLATVVSLGSSLTAGALLI